MSLLQPSGKRKQVQAQGMDQYDVTDSFLSNTRPEENKPSQGIGQELGSLFDPEAAMKSQDMSSDMDSVMGEEDTETDVDTDILDYIMKKLEGFGYPPRRLNEYKEEFVSEKLLPGAARDVAVVFPDMYYGKGKRLKRDEISKITEEIQSQFDLIFQDGERKDKKVFLNFVSRGQEGDSEEEMGAGDELDVAFGGGSAEKSKSKKKKVAETQSEMMKMSMQQAFDKIQKRGQ